MNFTRQENKVILALMEGLGNRELAERFGICQNTVKQHLHRISLKLGIDPNRYCVRVRIVWLLRDQIGRRVFSCDNGPSYCIMCGAPMENKCELAA
jgi:hypothetical protein